VSNDTLHEDTRIPNALNLPPGKLFFGFKYVPYKPPTAESSAMGSGATAVADSGAGPSTQAFTGQGSSLAGPSRRSGRSGAGAPSSSSSQARTESIKKEENTTPTHNWGTGSSLAGGSRPTASTSASRGTNLKRPPKPQKERSPTPDYGVDSDDDVIEIDSD
jgi:ubiquitin fusion degradation protein 1